MPHRPARELEGELQGHQKSCHHQAGDSYSGRIVVNTQKKRGQVNRNQSVASNDSQEGEHLVGAKNQRLN